MGIGHKQQTEITGTINEIEYVKFQNKLKSIYSGHQHTLFLLTNGNVFVVGSNQYGQIGEGKHIDHCPTIKQMKKLSNIKQIACCRYTSYALDKNGQLYSFGAQHHWSNNWYYISYSRCIGIKKISKEIEFRYIKCGKIHVGCMSEKNKLYTFESNDKGQCGVPQLHQYENKNKIIRAPRELILPNEIVQDIDCGNFHTLIKTKNGNYYSCGRNSNGQCLLFNKEEKIQSPTLIPLDKIKKIFSPKRIVKLIAGRQTTLILTV